VAYYQNPRWNSAASGSGGDPTYQQFWQDLYNGGADVASTVTPTGTNASRR
jgi:hypothetical protein